MSGFKRSLTNPNVRVSRLVFAKLALLSFAIAVSFARHAWVFSAQASVVELLQILEQAFWKYVYKPAQVEQIRQLGSVFSFLLAYVFV